MKSILLFICLTVTLPFTISAQVSVVGKWKIVKYDMDVTVGKKSEKGTLEAKEEYIYEFMENKSFKGNGWLNPFRGGINNSTLAGLKICFQYYNLVTGYYIKTHYKPNPKHCND